MNSTYRSKPLPALSAGALGLDAAMLGNVCEVRLDPIPARSLFMATDIKRMLYHSQTGNRAFNRACEIWRSPQNAEL